MGATLQQLLQIHRGRPRARAASCVAATGSRSPGTAGRRTAAARLPSIAATSSTFVCWGRLSNPLRCYSFPLWGFPGCVVLGRQALRRAEPPQPRAAAPLAVRKVLQIAGTCDDVTLRVCHWVKTCLMPLAVLSSLFADYQSIV